jgi:hypothetical protein
MLENNLRSFRDNKIQDVLARLSFSGRKFLENYARGGTIKSREISATFNQTKGISRNDVGSSTKPNGGTFKLEDIYMNSKAWLENLTEVMEIEFSMKFSSSFDDA